MTTVRARGPGRFSIEFPTHGEEVIEFHNETGSGPATLTSRVHNGVFTMAVGTDGLSWYTDNGTLVGHWAWVHGQWVSKP